LQPFRPTYKLQDVHKIVDLWHIPNTAICCGLCPFASAACKGYSIGSSKKRPLISIYLRRMWLSVSRPRLSRSRFDLQSSNAMPRPRSSRQTAIGRAYRYLTSFIAASRHQQPACTSTISWLQQQQTSQLQAAACTAQCAHHAASPAACLPAQ